MRSIGETRWAKGALLSIGLGALCLAGCAALGTGRIVEPGGFIGNDGTCSQLFFDEGRVCGKRNAVTVQRGSRLTKLTVAGDANVVVFEDGVLVPTIEVFGNDNTFSVPAGVDVGFAQTGHNNQLLRRPQPARARPAW